ncbi:hypothetical protein FJZ53_03870 [Candidatus Woesearchaeota archaeon]|nr:hypothetical protein [Candidatus Woesearchaeota archaeon]
MDQTVKNSSFNNLRNLTPTGTTKPAAKPNENNVLALKNQILEIVKRDGPVIPSQVSQHVVANLLFTSAILSDLASQDQVKLSKAKIGGSPVYYVKGQEPKLQMLYKYLGEKLKLVFDLLKEQQILRDKDLEPWQRVAVREIKDFAVMMTVNYNSQQEVFWKWYLIPDDEAKKIISETLKKEEPQPVKEEPKPELKHEAKKEEIEKKHKEVPAKKEETKLEPEKKLILGDKFYDTLNTYFSDNKIAIMEEAVIRKNTEYEFVIQIPSALGNLKYFVKAKNKKKVTDAELNMAYTTGERKKLPTIFMSTGDMTKKAEKYLEAHLRGLVFKKIK